MAYIKIDGNYIVDWSTGDSEKDRAHLFRAYRDFLSEVKSVANSEVLSVFDKWHVAELDVDDFPRISILRPEDKEV